MKQQTYFKSSFLLLGFLLTTQSHALFMQRGYTPQESLNSNEQLNSSVPQVQKPTTDRFEVEYAYDTLDPKDIYGTWQTLTLTNYQKISKDITIFYQTGFFKRKIENAFLASLGAYTDWSDAFYTYSQITVGTKSDYLAKYRVDNDFNFKFGEKKNIVGTVGITYVKAHNIHSDQIFSLGLTYYAPKYNASYRLSQNHSNPGNAVSHSHTLSMGYGREKWQWLYLDLSYGDQAYVSQQTEVNQDTKSAKISYRKWIDKKSGFFGNIGYFTLSEGYDKTNINLGYFIEY